MPKGYWIAHIDISNPEGYQAYVRADGPVFRKFGAKFLVRGGTAEPVEGRLRSRHIVIEFADYATALACYRSVEYQEARALRLPHASADIAIVEGHEALQP